MASSVTVIIVNWNGTSDTLDCLQSLADDHFPDKRIIVVDNGSKVSPSREIQDRYPDVEVIETGANLGFTGGNNAGIAHALTLDAKYVFLLNNDAIVEPGGLCALVSAAETNPDYGILTPAISLYDDPSQWWFAGSRMDLARGVAIHDNAAVHNPKAVVSELPWASGCAMLIPTSVIKALNGFDDRYFLFWEDVDLSLRCRNLGYRVGIVPGARARHKVAQSLVSVWRAGHYYYVRNNLLLVASHCKTGRLRATFRVLAHSLKTNAQELRRRRPGSLFLLWATLRAVMHHFASVYGRQDVT